MISYAIAHFDCGAVSNMWMAVIWRRLAFSWSLPSIIRISSGKSSVYFSSMAGGFEEPMSDWAKRTLLFSSTNCSITGPALAMNFSKFNASFVRFCFFVTKLTSSSSYL